MAPNNKRQKKLSRAEKSRLIADEFDLQSYEADVALPSNSMRTKPGPGKQRADAVLSRYPFFASGQRAVCKSSTVKPTCYGTFEGKKNSKLTSKRLLLNSPTEAEYRAACARADGRMKEGYIKPIRAGKIDLAFLSPAQAKKLSTLPGPNVRLCVRDDERGYLVPVSTPEQAQKLQQDFAECTKKKNMPACALLWAQKTTKQSNPPLGLMGSPGGLLGGLFTRGR